MHPANAAALCIKPRGQLTAKQVATIDRLKQVSSDFAVMRGLAMSFRGILRGGDASRLEGWLNDAFASGIHWMRQFVITLKRDIDAVRNAITTPWSNGQTEGQINKLKTLKRAMYGRRSAARSAAAAPSQSQSGHLTAPPGQRLIRLPNLPTQ